MQVCDRARMLVCVIFLGSNSSASAKQESHWKQSNTEQARWHAHDVHPLSRDFGSRALCLGRSLQRIGRFAKLLSGECRDAICWNVAIFLSSPPTSSPSSMPLRSLDWPEANVR